MFVDRSTLVLADDNFLYAMGYAYAFNGKHVPKIVFTHTDKDDALIMGVHDADADHREGAPPICDFDCRWLIRREIGTIVSVLCNPVVEIGKSYSKIYVLGDLCTVEGFQVRLKSVPKTWATTDRAWEVYVG